MISYLLLMFACFTISQASHLCPYPLPSQIEPCVCQVDDEYRISLICDFADDFASADFDRIVSAFDYNHNIFTFKIDLERSWNDVGSFSGQLNRNTAGRLNITHFIMQNVRLDVNDDLILEGAFEGSYGSIETIHIYSGIVQKNGSIDLDNVNAGPTLQSLKLSFVNHMSSSAFLTTPKLYEIVFLDSTFDHIPTNTFSGEFLPNITSIEMIGSSSRMTIQTNAFTNLNNLTSLKMTEMKSIGKIERSAFNNLPSLKKIEFWPDTIIDEIEGDSFVNLSSLEAFELTNVLSSMMTYLPRMITNSPHLTAIEIVNAPRVKSISENFFVGTPKLQSLKIKSNTRLEKLVIQNLSELNYLDIFDYGNYGNDKLQSITMKNLPNFREFNHLSWEAGYSLFSSASFSEMENLERIDLSRNYGKLKSILLNSTPNLQILDLGSNILLNHTGLNTSLHGLLHPNISINLQYTNVRYLDEFTFRPLIQRLNENSESTGKIDMHAVKLDCGCDVKWLVVDIGRTDFFSNAYCADETPLAEVDPILLEMMCPPDY